MADDTLSDTNLSDKNSSKANSALIVSPSDYVLVDSADQVLRITLNRPTRKNALNAEMYQALADIFHAGAAADNIKVILLQGSEDCFCSGNDLEDFFAPNVNGAQVNQGLSAVASSLLEDERSPLLAFMRELLYCDKPVVASVSGPAVGIAATLLLHCDLVYAAESATLKFPFVPLGLCPEFASTWLLPERIGMQRAAQCFYFGETIAAQRAFEWGLVNEVFTAQELQQQVWQKCLQLTRMPTEAMRATKHLLKQSMRETTPTVIESERRYFVRGLQSPEFAAVVQQFLNSRKG
jgi:enoyl-CoA hydratase/carnithine racemase